MVLVHPTCGPTQEDDIDGITRFGSACNLVDREANESFLQVQDLRGSKEGDHRYESGQCRLHGLQLALTISQHWAYLPYSMHMAGPREAIQHM